MKITVIIIMSTLLLTSVATSAKENLAKENMLEDTHILLGVDGMACPFCTYGIEKQLKKIEGVDAVSTNLEQGKIWVEINNNSILTEERAGQLLEDAGFTLRSFESHKAAAVEHSKHGTVEK